MAIKITRRKTPASKWIDPNTGKVFKADAPKKGAGSGGPAGRHAPKKARAGAASGGPAGRHTVKSVKKGTGLSGPAGRHEPKSARVGTGSGGPAGSQEFKPEPRRQMAQPRDPDMKSRGSGFGSKSSRKSKSPHKKFSWESRS